MKRIVQVEELDEAVVRREIVTLLKHARANVANRKAQLVLGAEFHPSDDDLLEGPMGQKMQRIFGFATGESDDDQMAVAEVCEEVLEFLWSSMFAGHYQIPDSFWDTPLGFAIYEVIGRVSNAPDNKELTSIQAAKYLGISQPYLHRLTRDGKVQMSRKVGTHARYRVGDLKVAKEQLARPARAAE
jgi:excisionase family DNA binding protein